MLSIFIVVEACIPGTSSSKQSGFLSQISAWFINLVKGPQIGEVIEPNEVNKVTDSTLLGQSEDGYSQIVVGSTTLLSLEANYPSKSGSSDSYDMSYTIDKGLGNDDDYNLILSSTQYDKKYQINIRIVANKMGEDLYSFTVNIGSTIHYEYKFNIVDLMTPTEYEAKINKSTLKIGETVAVYTKLTYGGLEDTYLRRYFDVNKIKKSSEDENIAYIDEFGVIHGASAGNTIVKFGTYDFPINVTNEHINKPNGNSLNIETSPNGNSSPCLLDYDYVFDGESDAGQYSTILYPCFADSSLEDRSVSWSISDNLKAKLAPYKYDKDGYPVYKDDSGMDCVRVCGYRNKGKITVICHSNSDNLTSDIVLDCKEAIATDMTLSISGQLNKVFVNDQKVITATFNPKNTFNKAINVEADNSDIISIKNNGTASVTVTCLKIGDVHLTISSISDPDIVKELDLSIEATQAINDANYRSFHTFVRKFAGHFALFLITSIFGYLFFYELIEDKKRLWLVLLLTLVSGFFLAGLSELIQVYVPGRTGAWLDVGIDYLGYVVGTIIMICVFVIIWAIQKRKSKSEVAKQ